MDDLENPKLENVFLAWLEAVDGDVTRLQIEPTLQGREVVGYTISANVTPRQREG